MGGEVEKYFLWVRQPLRVDVHILRCRYAQDKGMTVATAIVGCKRQDRTSQRFIFDRWSEGMLLLCMRYVKHLPDAEELMLNGFYKFYESIDRFVYSGDAGVTAWLKQIMVRECLGFLRKNGALKLLPEASAVEVGAEEGIWAELEAAELYRLVMGLPVGYSTVFNLYVVEGYTHKEIGAMLGISEGTSKSQLSKARAMLQKAVAKRC